MAFFSVIPTLPPVPLVPKDPRSAVGLAVGELAKKPIPPTSHVPPPTPIPPNAGKGGVNFTIAKGSITNLVTKEKREFMFNPTEAQRSDGWIWAEAKIPGASSPIYQGGSGKERTITLSIYLDADRGRMAYRARISPSGTLPPNKKLPNTDDRSLDLTPEINFFRQLTYPAQDNTAVTTTGRSTPARCVLRLGTLFPGVVVMVEDVQTTVQAWTSSLEPMRAVLSLTMKEFIRKTKTDLTFTKPEG